MSLPNLDVLLKKCEALGLKVTPKGKKIGKADCVRVLRQHFLPPQGLPYTEVTPMLCFAEWNLEDHERKAMQTGPGWLVQRKLNGCRLVVHAVKGVGWFAHSRTESVKTFRYEEQTDCLLIASHKPTFSATIDCEVMVEKSVDTRPYTAKGEITKTSLHSTTSILHLRPENSLKLQVEQDAPLMFHTFDIMAYEGQDVKRLKLRDRLKVLDKFKEILATQPETEKYFVFPEVVYEDRPAYVAKIIAQGGEGGIYKHLDSIYEDSSSRGRNAWVKVKKRIEYDAFVTGFKRGEAGTAWANMVGAIEFSVYTESGKMHAIGFGTNLTLEQREKVTVYDAATDTVSLNPAMYGKVAEISGQDISAREMRLSHCTIDRWRPKQGPDAKAKDDCRVNLADLKSASDWVG